MLCIIFYFYFFCTVHWADLSWPLFHYWLYPVWLCIWQINENLEPWSESSSERGRDCYLSEEAGLTLLLGKIQSFEDSDWLSVQEGNKRALLTYSCRVYYKLSLWNYSRTFSCFTIFYLSLHIIYVAYIFFFILFTMLSYLTFHRKWTATQ